MQLVARSAREELVVVEGDAEKSHSPGVAELARIWILGPATNGGGLVDLDASSACYPADCREELRADRHDLGAGCQFGGAVTKRCVGVDGLQVGLQGSFLGRHAGPPRGARLEGGLQLRFSEVPSCPVACGDPTGAASLNGTLDRVQSTQVPKGKHDLAGLVLDGVAEKATVVIQLRDFLAG